MVDPFNKFFYVRDLDMVFDVNTQSTIKPQAFNRAYGHQMQHHFLGMQAKPLDYLCKTMPQQIVDGITTWPGQPQIAIEGNSRKLNLWRASTLKAREGDIGPFIEHMNYLFDNDPVVIAALLAFMATLVQRPGVKIRWAPMIVGRQGIGKDLLVNILRKLLGPHNIVVFGPAEVISNFNDWSLGGQLLVSQEFSCGNQAMALDKIKPLITDDTVSINKKFAPVFQAQNRANYLLLSNREDAAPIDDAERRFLVHFSRAKPKASSYYSKLSGWIDGDGPAALLHVLLNADISQFNPNAPAPETASKHQMAEYAMTAAQAYVEEALQARRPPFQGDLVILTDAVDYFKLEKRIDISTKRLAQLIRRHGGTELGQIRFPDGSKPRVWAMQNADQWSTMSESEIAEAYKKALVYALSEVDRQKLAHEFMLQAFLNATPVGDPDTDDEMLDDKLNQVWSAFLDGKPF